MLKVISSAYILIQALPQILQIVRDIIAFFREERDKAARRDLQKKTAEAIHKAAKEKDTSDLENLFRSGNA